MSKAATVESPFVVCHVELHRVEGREEFGVAKSMKDADHILRKWAVTAPEGPTYDKVDFSLLWTDGRQYGGRFDLKREHKEQINLLSNHVLDFVEFHAGRRTPGHMSREEHEQFLQSLEGLGTFSRDEWASFVDTREFN